MDYKICRCGPKCNKRLSKRTRDKHYAEASDPMTVLPSASESDTENDLDNDSDRDLDQALTQPGDVNQPDPTSNRQGTPSTTMSESDDELRTDSDPGLDDDPIPFNAHMESTLPRLSLSEIEAQLTAWLGHHCGK